MHNPTEIEPVPTFSKSLADSLKKNLRLLTSYTISYNLIDLTESKHMVESARRNCGEITPAHETLKVTVQRCDR